MMGWCRIDGNAIDIGSEGSFGSDFEFDVDEHRECATSRYGEDFLASMQMMRSGLRNLWRRGSSDVGAWANHEPVRMIKGVFLR